MGLHPVLYVTFVRDGEIVSASCLLESGSGPIYMFSEFLNFFGSFETVRLACEFSLFTLLGYYNKWFQEVVLRNDVGFHCSLSLSMLVDKNIVLSVSIKELNSLLEEFQRIICLLAGRFDRGTNFIPINGITELDLIQHLVPIQQLSARMGFSAPT